MSTHHTDALLRFARRWFDERTVAGVFEPLVADWQREWSEAPASRHPLIFARGALAFATSVIACAPLILAAPPPPSMTRRVLGRIIIFTAAVSALLTVPIWLQLRELPLAQQAAATFWLLPAGIVLAFPFAMLWIVDAIRRQTRPTRIERINALRISIMAVLFMIVVGGWVVPAANQEFREIAAPEYARPPARGARELTTPQLIQAPWLAQAEGRERSQAIQRELHNRASFALLPIVLMWLRWRALIHPSPQWLPAWLSATVTSGVYFFLRENDTRIESLLGLEPGAAAWVPLVLFLVLGWIRDHTAQPTVTSIFHA